MAGGMRSTTGNFRFLARPIWLINYQSTLIGGGGGGGADVNDWDEWDDKHKKNKMLLF